MVEILKPWSVFVVVVVVACRMDYGEWTEDSRGTYNKGDGVARSTIQVYPRAWAAVLVSLDNVGVWNVRSQNLDSWYLGQEVYVRVVNSEDAGNKTEMAIPGNALFCGQLHKYQKYAWAHPQITSFLFSSTSSTPCSCLLMLSARAPPFRSVSGSKLRITGWGCRPRRRARRPR